MLEQYSRNKASSDCFICTNPNNESILEEETSCTMSSAHYGQ